MPGPQGRRLALSFAAAATAYAAATTAWPSAWAEPSDAVDQPTPCWSEQVAVSASPTQAAVGHRGVTLLFALAGGADPCTLTGYPGVDSGSGGPLIHAQPTPRGYLGGLPSGIDVPPTVTLSLSTQGQAVVEGMAVDADGNPCPGYTDLAVSPPAIMQVFTVPATIEACGLEVHPVTAG